MTGQQRSERCAARRCPARLGTCLLAGLVLLGPVRAEWPAEPLPPCPPGARPGVSARAAAPPTERRAFTMEIKRVGTQPSSKGPAEWFTGTVRIDPLFQAHAPARAAGASVTFEPGARTAWHTHPLGQTLIVTAGCGWAQRWGGPVEEIRPGDVVWFPPGEKHWHGASARRR